MVEPPMKKPPAKKSKAKKVPKPAKVKASLPVKASEPKPNAWEWFEALVRRAAGMRSKPYVPKHKSSK
jgi:hypothetical protein